MIIALKLPSAVSSSSYDIVGDATSRVFCSLYLLENRLVLIIYEHTWSVIQLDII